MNAGTLCTRKVDVATKDESVQTVAARMHQRSVGTLVVVDDANVPVGIVTDRDLTVRVLAHGRDAVLTPVGDVMTLNPRSVATSASLEMCVGLMRAGPFRRLVVVDRSGVLVGVLSLDDVLAAMAHDLETIRGLLGRESPDAVAAT